MQRCAFKSLIASKTKLKGKYVRHAEVTIIGTLEHYEYWRRKAKTS